MIVSYVIITLVAVILLAAIAYVLLKLNATLEAYQARIDPLVEQAQSILTVANSKLNSIGDKTEAILTQGEVTAEVVHETVEKTASMVQRTVNTPLIGLNALSAGLSRAVRTFGSLQSLQAESIEGVSVRGDLIRQAETAPSYPAGGSDFGVAHSGERVRTNV